MTRFATGMPLATLMWIGGGLASAAAQETGEITTAVSLLKIMGVTAPIGADLDKNSDEPAPGSQDETVRRLTEKVERVKAGRESGRPAARSRKSPRP